MAGQGEGLPGKVVLGVPDPSQSCVGRRHCRGDLLAGSFVLGPARWATQVASRRAERGRGMDLQLGRGLMEKTIPSVTQQPHSAFPSALSWEMEQLSPPRDHSDLSKVTQQWEQSWGLIGPGLHPTCLLPTPRTAVIHSPLRHPLSVTFGGGREGLDCFYPLSWEKSPDWREEKG